MRHRSTKIRMNRPADQRKALVRNLITSLFLSGKVQTTESKARALESEANKLITKIKGKASSEAIRDLKRIIFTKESSKKALDYVNSNKDRASGFVRSTKLGYRAGDGALLVQVELI